MQLYTVGINHTTAPIAIREKVAFDPDHLSQALRDLMDNKVNEAAILSTCNRSEIYAKARDPQIIVDWLCEYHGIKLKTIESHLLILPLILNENVSFFSSAVRSNFNEKLFLGNLRL